MELGRNRIEALTDGVFAVAMTLLVLDIKVPELQQPLTTADLAVKLFALWPKFLSYTISFVILGVYWIGHHVHIANLLPQGIKPITTTNHESICTVSRFGPPGRLCNGSSTAADS